MSNSQVERETVLLTESDIQRTLKRLAHELLEANRGSQQLVLLGIVTRGKYLAERLAKLIEEIEGKTVPLGFLDITLYRDDATRTFKSTQQTIVPVDITDKHVILIDDVIYSGRTIGSALDALKDFGRPASVQLLVLLDRGHRELPISANFVGKNIPTTQQERVDVRIQEVDGSEAVVLRTAQ